MKTDALIEMLASAAGPIAPGYAIRRFAIAVVVGTACAAVLMATMLGARHDIAQAVLLPMFWVKLAFVASLAGLGIVGAWRLSMPARRSGTIARAIAGVVAALWTVGGVALAQSAPQARPALLLGSTWTSCPWLIAGLSVPVFVAVAWAMKGMAPTHLHRAGAMAGFASGALAAFVYSIHCPELGAPFLGIWYVAGIAIPAGVGALLGERLFRW
jgi:hypothetical protein